MQELQPERFPAQALNILLRRFRPICCTKYSRPTFFAQVSLTNTLLPLIRKSEAGRIVNLSSILGSLALHADPNSPIYHAKSFAYDASKTALNAYTVHLAYELRDTNIKVNSAHPGWVKTDMGGAQAPMELSEGGKTSAALATLPDDGPSGGYFHLGKPLPW
jgi:NAD(P)-dependent dehydrogenase (short-subunit alcohol dehydrogenase family)